MPSFNMTVQLHLTVLKSQFQMDMYMDVTSLKTIKQAAINHLKHNIVIMGDQHIIEDLCEDVMPPSFI